MSKTYTLLSSSKVPPLQLNNHGIFEANYLDYKNTEQLILKILKTIENNESVTITIIGHKDVQN